MEIPTEQALSAIVTNWAESFESILAVYLHGSLVQGGYQPGRSDVDITLLPERVIDAPWKITDSLHQVLSQTFPQVDFDISFVLPQTRSLFAFQVLNQRKLLFFP